MDRRWRRRWPALVATTAAVLSFTAAVAAQTPSELIDGCGRTGPRIDRQTGMGLQETKLTVSVPGTGTWFSLPASPEEAPFPSLFICHVESSSSIIIDARTGEEVGRTIGSSAGASLLDEVIANARVEPIVLPTPFPLTPGVPMTPPHTGSGGLKSPG
jgi:hypothetical protein